MDRPRKTVRHYNDPGHAHVLTFSCYLRLPLLSRDRTRNWLVQALDAARSRQNFAVLAYVIMPEHAHVLVYPRDDKADVSAFLKSVKQSVARKARLHLAEYAPEWIRRLSVRTPSGPVFRFWQQGPGFDRNIYSLDALRSEIEYIHNNPVRRGLTKSPAEWEWTSAQWLSNPGVGRLKIDSIDEIFE